MSSSLCSLRGDRHPTLHERVVLKVPVNGPITNPATWSFGANFFFDRLFHVGRSEIDQTVDAKHQVHLAPRMFSPPHERRNDFGLEDAALLLSVTPEAIERLSEARLARSGTDWAHTAQAQERRGSMKKLTNARIIQRVRFAFQHDAVDSLKGLMNEQVEKDDCRSSWA